MIDIRPIRGRAYALRVYDTVNGSLRGDEYRAALVIRQRGVVARVGPAHGELSRSALREICMALHGKGVCVLRIRRRAGHRVPRARYVRSVGAFDLWELWL